MMSATAKIDIYDLYKPLRNHLQTLDLQALLEMICMVQSGHEDEVAIKLRGAFGRLIGEIFRWELHILAREALLHSSVDRNKKQPTLQNLIELVNGVRRICEGVSRRTIGCPDEAVRSLHPVGHQQMRWQNSRDWDRFFRTFRIYNRKEIHQLLHEVSGVRLTTIYTLTFAIAGGVRRSGPWVLATQNFEFLGIPSSERDAYFAMVGSPHASLSKSVKSMAHYDQRWAFTWNPLEATPLIQLRADQPDQYLCPLPELLLRRATDSLFFDLAKSSDQCSNPYGTAFQDYVGDVLRAQFKGPVHRVHEEQEYWIGKKKKHGVDWIVEDPSGHIMLECKTRRIRVDAMAAADGEQLANAIDDLAKMVVQHYKNIDDALRGHAKWRPDGKPVYPVVVTLDDWRLFAPHVIEMLKNRVREQLVEIALSALLESSPFIVTSIAELELAGQAIAQIGIDRFFASRVMTLNPHFDLRMHASQAFPEIKVNYARLFPDSDQEMFGHLAHLMDLPGELLARGYQS